MATGTKLHRIIASTVLGLLLAGASDTYAQQHAVWRYQKPQNGTGFVGWCTGPQGQQNQHTCGVFSCDIAGGQSWDRQPYFSIFTHVSLAQQPELPFSFTIDGKRLLSGRLVNRGPAEGFQANYWLTKEAIPVEVMRALAKGSQLQLDVAGRRIAVPLTGSARAIYQLDPHCHGNFKQPQLAANPAQPQATTLTPDLARQCAPYRSAMRLANRSTIPPVYSGESFVWRDKVRKGDYESGKRTFQSYDGSQTIKVELAYMGQIWGWTGFRFEIPRYGNAGLSADQRAQLDTIKRLVSKFFEWRAVAQANGVRNFERDMPENTRPNISQARNFKFHVGVAPNGNVAHGVSGIYPHGLCWLLDQVTSLEAAIPQVRATFQQWENQQQIENKRQQQLENKFN